MGFVLVSIELQYPLPPQYEQNCGWGRTSMANKYTWFLVCICIALSEMFSLSSTAHHLPLSPSLPHSISSWSLTIYTNLLFTHHCPQSFVITKQAKKKINVLLVKYRQNYIKKENLNNWKGTVCLTVGQFEQIFCNKLGQCDVVMPCVYFLFLF